MKQTERNPDIEFEDAEFDMWSEQIVLSNKDMMIFDHSIYPKINPNTTLCVWHSECAKIVVI